MIPAFQVGTRSRGWGGGISQGHTEGNHHGQPGGTSRACVRGESPVLEKAIVSEILVQDGL